MTLPETIIEKIAVQQGFLRVVEFGMADLLSLEPIDKKFRPLRLNIHLIEDELWEKTYVVKYTSDPKIIRDIKELRLSILQLLRNECNMRRVVRLCKGVYHEDRQVIYDPYVPDIQEWIRYRQYLTELGIRLKLITKNQQKMAACIDLFYGDNKYAEKQGISRKQANLIDANKFTINEVVQAFRACLTNAKLASLWNVTDISNKEYIFPYVTPTNKMRPRNRHYYRLLWKDYMWYPGF